VRSWGGFLHIKSELGQGTQVRLFLPRATGAADVPDADAGQTPAVLAGAGETVLVVEDEKLVRLGVRQQLEDLGYVVLTAGTAHEALEVLRARSIVLDLLLTDVVLPGMSGPELIVAAREQRPRLAVLLMSAFPQEELVAHGRIEPGTPTLEKPFTDKALGLKVHEALSAGRTSSSGD
jgi:CheY-like chemotaxis protein